MWPIIFDFGEINIFGFEFHPVINSYGFMMMIAFYSCYYLLNKDLNRLGYDAKLAADLVFAAAVGGILGSKIYYLIENFDRVKADPMGMIFSGAGLVFLGGLMGGTLAVTFVIKKEKLTWIKFADIVAPLLILGYAIGRIGCLLVGDDYGLPTDLPWGISFPDGLPPSTYAVFQTYYPWVNLSGFEPGVLTVHPTQIYETLLGLGIFYYLYNKRMSVVIVGSLFFTYLIFAGSERFLIEFLRVNTKYAFGLSGSQLISLSMIGIGAWFLTHPVNVPQEEPSEK
ncbi:MAG: prolipoprotein diacylglyceryl transferase [Candidatus Marinimicrobia bacterium]|jgi:phosphatidylglycerol:prolipoprotein diacylglycerol transferase|nr:prolipoprotein diacylglyceryl transferase [Candidatus Neomarinimicrobiota bacterium]MBT3675594.1 prolipoprotein diacylglyceryl transferase [Candidatus Neomarinimicrobiota bacterium]MBT3763936.1 prolipoprotein diacylglyceryl transferase [Candidatus Neomarinimicrobiota bacterium]MBT4067183.1 prolipoprotein diacylglyceryl transferase [Candidatus Neomarinimicrobiota bacterium]MBT4270039.1 prolipoprotein diacylglyceryl transferase [Candidatus Neomarinimicrobiota bacterium]